jgi:O-antigen/teichoic acid export membrane protein
VTVTVPVAARRRGGGGAHRMPRQLPLARLRPPAAGPKRRRPRAGLPGDVTPGGHAAPSRLHEATAALGRSGTVAAVARTAGFNMLATAAAGLGGVLLARAVGPTVRGEYAAITAWLGIALMIGEIGQPAALCFYVASDPGRARDYLATSRAMMLVTGGLALTGGMFLAPVLGHGQPALTDGYRIAFGTSIVAFAATAHTFSLQARDLSRWNKARTAQPVLAMIAIAAAWRLQLLNLDVALVILAGTLLIQMCWAYRCCQLADLTSGRARRVLVRPLAAYGAAQITALAPGTLNAYLDTLVLSQTVPPAELGRYAIAVSLSLLPVPLVSAVGYVAFPRLAAQRAATMDTSQLQRIAVLSSAGIATAMLLPLAAAAYWLVPVVFGAGYQGAVPLLWILAPGAVFLACGQVTGDLLRGRNRPLVVAWAQGLAAVFTVALLIALLPVVGVYGAAIASTVAYAVALAAMLRCLWRLPADGAPPGQALASADPAGPAAPGTAAGAQTVFRPRPACGPRHGGGRSRGRARYQEALSRRKQ